MIINKIGSLLCVSAVLWSNQIYAAAPITYNFNDSSQKIETVGVGECQIHNGVLSSQGAYAVIGAPDLKNYTVEFDARTPQGEDQVQIWAGFRTANRYDRYVVGIKGGLQDDLYLMRTGYMGMDELMGVRPLGFHPVPGEWHKLKIEVCDDRIRVFVDDNALPHIDITDSHSAYAAQGPVSLGGAWLPAEFDNVVITPIPAGALANVKREELSLNMTENQKETLRQQQRSQYTGKSLPSVNPARTVMDLDGEWLFMPSYGIDDLAAVTASTDDQNWHVMTVPNFWNPSRIWLHGETMGSASGHQSKGVSDTYYQQETDRCENYTFNFHKTAYAWYRQWIDLPQEINGKDLTLHFDAVSKSADVYINGELAGSHLGMFGEFDIDATALLHPGRNLIVVGVARDLNGEDSNNSAAMENYYASVRKDVNDNKDDATANAKVSIDIPHGFFQENPAGIWQPVTLVITSPLKITDVAIQPNLTGANFDVDVTNHNSKAQDYTIEAVISSTADGSVLYQGSLSNLKSLNPNNTEICHCTISDVNPKLWSPEHPNLYDFTFKLKDTRGKVVDEVTITSGFRTFEAKDGYLYLNGKKYWLKGGNHIPFALAPNDQELAHKFMQFMKEGNLNSTRTHTTPWNELWVSEADRMGVAISFEGTWTWLMIHSTPIPDQATLDLWHDEWINLIKKYRNHPSVVFWTVNNEMKFYDLDADTERAKQKFHIISDAVADMRAADPTRPISFDSNYVRNKALRRFGPDFFADVDDGDIDDNHAYYNWYDYSVFNFFNGEFQKESKYPGRPLISQEMSTGYPNGETGHPTRSYQLIHQNPYSLIGYEAYDWADPKTFLKVQSFITGELAECLRRTCDEASGIMHFAYMTWFRQCYDAQNIEPYPTYYAMQRAMQPVLVSAELWGRHAYAGQELNPRVYVVNDDSEGRNLSNLMLSWKLTSQNGSVLSQGKQDFPDVAYYQRKYITPTIEVPAGLNGIDRACLSFELHQGGKTLSRNHYDLALGSHPWASYTVEKDKKVLLISDKADNSSLNSIGLTCTSCPLAALKDKKPKYDLYVVADIAAPTQQQAQALRNLIKNGAHVLILNTPELAQTVFPEYITGISPVTEGDIAVMERPENKVFDGLDFLDLRYFNNNQREMPSVCHSMIHANRSPHVTELASHMRIHSYLDDQDMDARTNKINELRGLTMLTIEDGDGLAMVSTMATEKADTDPVAGRLLSNMVNEMLR